MAPRVPQEPEAQLALGKAIRDLRKKQGINQGQLANRAGITANMLSLIELGQANPSWVTARGIAKALNVSISRLAQLAEGFEHQ